jgi:hypothetical protein
MSQTALPASTEDLLVAQVRAQWKGRRGAALLLLAICLVGAVASWAAFDLSERGPARAVGGGLVGTLLSAVLLATTLGDPRRRPAIDVLRTAAGKVVWVYLVQPPRPPWTQSAWARSFPGLVKESTLMLGLEDGKRLTLGVQAGSERPVLEAVTAAAPGASRGFTAAREAQFKRSPASLRQPQVGPSAPGRSEVGGH